jgi:hypothetical protein
MSVQFAQTEAGPELSTKVPVRHVVHCELFAVVHVSVVSTQFATKLHGLQTELGPELSRYIPSAHAVHCEFVPLVQAIWLVQNGTGVQIGHESAAPFWPSCR